MARQVIEGSLAGAGRSAPWGMARARLGSVTCAKLTRRRWPAAGPLRPGEVIRVRHRHEGPPAQCLACWETDAVVTDDPVPVSGRTAIRWAGDGRIRGSQAGITGISLFCPASQPCAWDGSRPGAS